MAFSPDAYDAAAYDIVTPTLHKYTTDNDYWQSLKCLVEIYDNKGRTLLLSYDSFNPESNSVKLLDCSVSLGLTNTQFTIKFEDGNGIIDQNLIGLGNKVLVYAGRTADNLTLLFTGYSESRSPVILGDNVMDYEMTGFGENASLNDIIVNFKRASSEMRDIEDPNFPRRPDSKMVVFELVTDLFEDQDVRVTRDIILKDYLNLDISGISPLVTERLLSISQSMQELSSVLNFLCEVTGAYWKIENGKLIFEYPEIKHSGIIIKNKPHWSDLASSTSYFINQWRYTDSISKEDGFANRLYTTTATDTKSVANAMSNQGATSLFDRAIAVQVTLMETRLNTLAFIMSKIGDPFTPLTDAEIIYRGGAPDNEEPEPPECPTGYHLDPDTNQCVPDYVPPPIVCPTGYHVDPATQYCVLDTPPPPGGDEGQLDSYGIMWQVARGDQFVVEMSRDTADDDRWSGNITGLRQGAEATFIGRSKNVASDGHFAMKIGGGNHSSGDWENQRWYDFGLRANGDIQIQYEGPHPNNHYQDEDFTIPSSKQFITNIGKGLEDSWIGLKWVVQTVTPNGSPENGGVRCRMWVDKDAIGTDNKPRNNWELAFDFIDGVDTEVVQPQDYEMPDEWDCEVRRSGTENHDLFGLGNIITDCGEGDPGLHVRRLGTPSEPTPQCPAGYHYDPTSRQCVIDATPACPSGYHWDATLRRCVLDTSQTCPTGYHWDGTLQRCVLDTPPPPPPSGGGEAFFAVVDGFDNYTEWTNVLTHEIVEQQANPWYDSNPGFATPDEDISDVCSGNEEVQIGTGGDDLVVNTYYSNRRGGCVAPPVLMPNNSPTNTITNYGGPVLDHCVIYLIFWGSSWHTRTQTPTKTGIESRIQLLCSSEYNAYFSELSQYRNIQPATYGGSVINDYSTIGSTYNDENISFVVKDTLDRNLLPYNAQGLYLICPQVGCTNINGYDGSADHFLYTRPSPPSGGQAFKFNIAGDFRSGSDAEATASNLVSDSPNVIFMLGDYAVGDATEEEWCNEIMAPVKNSGIPVWGCNGNHDNDDYLTVGFFENTNWVWSVKYGNIAFISCDTIAENVSATQTLVAAAQNNSAIMRIVILMHESVFKGENGSTSGSDTTIAYHNMFKQYSKLKLVIAGHSHNWTRFAPWEGIQYIINEDGGQQPDSDTGCMHCSSDANGNLTLSMVSNGGNILDTFTIPATPTGFRAEKTYNKKLCDPSIIDNPNKDRRKIRPIPLQQVHETVGYFEVENKITQSAPPSQLEEQVVKGEIRIDNNNTPNGPVISQFKVQVGGLSSTADTIFVNDIKVDASVLSPNGKYWIVMFPCGTSYRNTVLWHHDGDLSTHGKYSAFAKGATKSDLSDWNVSEYGPTYTYAVFAKLRRIQEYSDPQSIERFRLKEDIAEADFLDDTVSVAKLMQNILAIRGKPVRKYNINEVTLPLDTWFTPGQNVTIVDDTGHHEEDKNIFAEIQEVSYSWSTGSAEDTVGTFRVRILPVGHLNWHKELFPSGD